MNNIHSDDESNSGSSSGGHEVTRQRPSPRQSVASTPSTRRRGGRNVEEESPATPVGDSPSVARMESPDTPPTPRSTQTAIDGLSRGSNDSAAPPMQQVEEPAADEPAAPLFGNSNEAHIRGTDVNVPRAAATFTDFLRNFVSLRVSKRNNRDANESDDDDDDDSLFSHNSEENEPFYMKKLQRILDCEIEGTASLDIDSIHLFYHNAACQQLYHQLVQYPMEIVPLMDIMVQRELGRLAQNMDVPLPHVQVRPFNLKTVSNLRELDPVSMDCLVCCKGMIVRSSAIIPDLKVAHFGCAVCGNSEVVTIDRGRISEPPDRCGKCGTLAWELVHNRCVFADKQMVRLQETPDEVPAGQTPASVNTFCFDDLVDHVHPGKVAAEFSCAFFLFCEPI
jgi:DNA replication licensing factor MCM4